MVIKTLNTENPFADFGGIVEGERFVGRSNAINAIHSRVLGTSYGNIAIMGLPRIGKSSLAWNALMVRKKSFAERKILIERVNVGSIKSAKEFYLRLMDKTLPNVRNLSFELYNQLSESKNAYSKTESENEIEYFFALVKQNNYRLIYILDEFDNVINFFKLEDFQLLRELSISPETKICLVTVSRRTIQELEPENGAISNFYGVFADLHLKLFDENELSAYWNRLEKIGITVASDYKSEVQFFVGSHPFWLDLVNYHIFNKLKESELVATELLSDTSSELKKTLWDNYDDIIELMNKEGLKSQFIQAVVGPVINLSQMGIERLAKYGLVSPVMAKEKYGQYFQRLLKEGLAQENDISYNSISQHLNDYLKQKENEFDIWGLWNEAEHCVRNLITVYLKEKYGEDWRDKFILKNPKQENNIKKMESMRDENKRRFGELASDNLIRYTYPLEMWDVFINSEWTWFQRVFGGQQNVWKEKFSLLARIRNPIAHSNQDFVLKDTQSKAKEICNEILEKVTAWQMNK